MPRLPATLLPPSHESLFPSGRPHWSPPSPSVPVAYKVPFPETFNPPGNGRPHQGLHTYAPAGLTYSCAKPNSLLLKTPWMVTENTGPCRNPMQTKHKWMTFLQHLCLHKAAAVLPHPVNTSDCTFPPEKSSGQIRGTLLKIADRGKTTTEPTPGCASTGLAAGWRLWRITVGRQSSALGQVPNPAPVMRAGPSEGGDSFQQRSGPWPSQPVYAHGYCWSVCKGTVATKCWLTPLSKLSPF